MKWINITSIWLIILVSCQNKPKDKSQFSIPEWSKGIVWYQIFPERFCNGDTLNDPQLADIAGAWPYDTTNPWQIHPWGADWYKLLPYEKTNGKDIWYNISRRRFGGDLEGIISKLDYLKELGIGAIYLNPVFWAPSHHKYDAVCYHHIDPTFGPDPEGDKKLMSTEIPDDTSTWVWTKADLLALKLIQEVHKRGMKIVFDGVFNHMGYQSFAFQDVIRKQQKSRFKDWFEIESFEDSVKGTSFQYKGWFGVKDLPELKENNNMADGPKQYIFSSIKKWMKPVVDGKSFDGIDGWRLDVAFCLSDSFLMDLRKFCRSLNPDCYLVAEVIDSPDKLNPYLQHNKFDGIMNYNFLFYTSSYFIPGQNSMTATRFMDKMEKLYKTTGDFSYSVQNLLGSHDIDRVASRMVNPDVVDYANWENFFNQSRATNPSYRTTKPDIEDYAIEKQMLIFQMTWPGAPMIYYGDEAGMWGANDPDCRKPMIWENLHFEHEKYLPDGSQVENPQAVSVNYDLLTFYKKMIRIRNVEPALKRGDLNIFLKDDKNKVIGYSRTYQGETLYIFINSDTSLHKYPLQVRFNGDYRDLISHRGYRTDNYRINVKIKARSGAIIKRN